jgi:hypothetical protein
MKRKDLPRTAIIQGILRSETVNPAIVQRGSYAVHVRRLPHAGEHAWVVRIISAEGTSARTSKENR